MLGGGVSLFNYLTRRADANRQVPAYAGTIN
jgi:hypothetical protein